MVKTATALLILSTAAKPYWLDIDDWNNVIDKFRKEFQGVLYEAVARGIYAREAHFATARSHVTGRRCVFEFLGFLFCETAREYVSIHNHSRRKVRNVDLDASVKSQLA